MAQSPKLNTIKTLQQDLKIPRLTMFQLILSDILKKNLQKYNRYMFEAGVGIIQMI